MLTREETRKIVARIFDSIRPSDSEHIGEYTCDDLDCIESKCPFRNLKSCVCPNNEGVDGVFNTLEFVEQWAKEHSPVTYEQKYEEIFGVKPLQIDKCTKNYLCPKHAGFDIGINCNAQSCEKCKEGFWNSEYKEPVKEGVRKSG